MVSKKKIKQRKHKHLYKLRIQNTIYFFIQIFTSHKPKII